MEKKKVYGVDTLTIEPFFLDIAELPYVRLQRFYGFILPWFLVITNFSVPISWTIKPEKWNRRPLKDENSDTARVLNLMMMFLRFSHDTSICLSYSQFIYIRSTIITCWISPICIMFFNCFWIRNIVNPKMLEKRNKKLKRESRVRTSIVLDLMRRHRGTSRCRWSGSHPTIHIEICKRYISCWRRGSMIIDKEKSHNIDVYKEVVHQTRMI